MTSTITVASPTKETIVPLRLEKLNEREVIQAMQDLAEEAKQDGLEPSLVIGILNGGRDPAVYFAEAWEREVPLIFLKLQRRSSGRLKQMLVNLVTAGPASLVDYLRLLEMRLRDSRQSHNGSAPRITPVTDLTPQVKTAIENLTITPERPVFIVDDALDTGMTAARIVSTLEHAGVPIGMTRVVCITQTLSAPFLVPDYVAFKRIVFRFPWSLDADTPLSAQAS